VYGFEGKSAALVLEVDQLLKDGWGEKSVLKHFSPIQNDFVLNAVNLLTCNESARKESYDEKMKLGVYKPDKISRINYLVNGLVFSVNYPNSEVYAQLHPVFKHLLTR